MGFGNIFNPIGAFYDSQSPVQDYALSIAISTPVLLDTNRYGISPIQLTALDLNHDNQLTGAELSGLQAWADRNENGIADAGEITTLSALNITHILAQDYKFYTEGNSQLSDGVAAAPMININAPALSVPDSYFSNLRNNDNHRTISTGTKVMTPTMSITAATKLSNTPIKAPKPSKAASATP